jgi:GxxExxY protein
MNSNDTNKKEKIVYKELSYLITGVLFEVHNKLGRYGREKQYGDMFETFLKDKNISYEREKELPVDKIQNQFTNRVDFVINNQLLIDLKTKDIVTKEDFYQMNRYLDASGMKLGLIVNFRNKYLKPIRVIRANS